METDMQSTMTLATCQCEVPTMNDESPGNRLREARMRLRLTREALAELTGRSPATVRAHEIGQNNILPDVAEAYAAPLGVPASWILYGGAPPVRADVRQIKVKGIVRRGVWVESPFAVEIEDFVMFQAPEEYASIELSAYQVGDDSSGWPIGAHLITAPQFLVPMQVGDQVVARRERSGMVEVAVRLIHMEGKGPYAYLEGPATGSRPADRVYMPNSPKAIEGEVFYDLGIVIGAVWRMPEVRIAALGHDANT